VGIGDKRIRDFAEETAAPTPTPGGGSVAAVCGAVSAALARMVAGLAIGKDDYRDSQDELRRIQEEGKSLQDRLLALADEDSAAYEAVAAAIRLPKMTPEDKKRRTEALQFALKKAAEVPLSTMELCNDVIALSKTALEKGSKNAFTDAGSAALIAHAALEAAGLNVKVNLLSIKDEAFRAKSRANMDSMLKTGSDLAEQVSRIVDSRF
jgi:glutamate formiminotransferase/formiminotetrahydrofolate cyclodeaminase